MITVNKNLKMNNTEQVICYLDGELNEVELIDFEELLKHNPDLYEDLNFVKDVERSFKDRCFEEFIKSLHKAHQNFIENCKPLKGKVRLLITGYKKLYKVAVVILILITTLFSLIYKSSLHHARNEKLFAQYFWPYQGDVTSRSGEDIISSLQMAFQSYKNRQYQEAIGYFDKIQDLNNTAIFYKGISCMECGDFNSALNCFNQVTNNPTGLYYAQARWYVALTWLKLNKPENAKIHLEWLLQHKQSYHYYGVLASDVLKELQNN
jgi:tetratricopeptide (TPR) repeat protein